jgi:hypothetical protein
MLGDNMTRYMCIRTGGSIGEKTAPKIFDTKEEAQEYGKEWVRSFGGGRKSYYRPGYKVKVVSERDETRRTISWMGVTYNI